MKRIETVGLVTEDHQLSARLPVDVPPGEHRMVIVLEETHADEEQPVCSQSPVMPPLRWQANVLVHDGTLDEGFSNVLNDIRQERIDNLTQGGGE